MSDVAVEATEAAMASIEEAVDGIVEVVEVVRNNPIVLVTVGALGLVAGGVGGYFFAKKQLREHFEQLATEEIADAKVFYANLNKVGEDGETLTPQDVLAARHGQDAVDAVRIYQGREPSGDPDGYPEGEPHDDIVDEAHLTKMEESLREKRSVKSDGETVEVVEEVETRNVFADPTFDLEEEKKYRTDEKPYIITHDEFFAADREYENSSLTYYEVDDTLTDEHDKPIENTDEIVGDDHLVRFGSGSKDKNIVYVRNEKLETDYEVIKSSGSYLEEVLGMEADEEKALKHSDQRDRRRAFRHGDE